MSEVTSVSHNNINEIEELRKVQNNKAENQSCEESVFAGQMNNTEYETPETAMEKLEAEFEEVKDEMGVVSKVSNGIRGLFGGNSTKKVEKMMDKFSKGEATQEEVEKSIEDLRSSNKRTVGTLANIGSCVCCLIPGGIGIAAGAAIKVGINGLEKGTNEVKGDYTAKDVIKDGVSGGMNAGVGRLVNKLPIFNGAGTTVASKVGIASAKGAVRGSIKGGINNAIDYSLEAATNDDVNFNVGELAKYTTTGAVAGGVTGGVAGAFYGASQTAVATAGNPFTHISDNSASEIISDITSSSANKIVAATDETIHDLLPSFSSQAA